MAMHTHLKLLLVYLLFLDHHWTWILLTLGLKILLDRNLEVLTLFIFCSEWQNSLHIWISKQEFVKYTNT